MAYLDELQKQRQMQELGPYEQGLQKEMSGESPVINPGVSNTANPGMSAQQKQGFDQADMAGLAAAGAGGAMVGGPVGAGIAVGGQLASSYLNNKAAAERQRRERSAQIAEQYGQDQSKGYQIAMQALQGGFR